MNPGFYKYDGIDFFYGPTAVYAPTYTLLAGAHTTYTYPVDGWTWFDDQDTAYQQLNYTPPVATQTPMEVVPTDALPDLTN